MYISLAQKLPEIWLETLKNSFWQKPDFVRINEFSLLNSKKCKNRKIDTFMFWPYLWQFLSYRDIPYLILILTTIPFDLMKSNFAIELIGFELYGQTSVPFFPPHFREKLPLSIDWIPNLKFKFWYTIVFNGKRVGSRCGYFFLNCLYEVDEVKQG